MTLPRTSTITFTITIITATLDAPTTAAAVHNFVTLPSVQHIKGKAVLLQAWSGPEVSRKLRFPDFMTTAQDGGKVVSLTHRPSLPPGNIPGTHF